MNVVYKFDCSLLDTLSLVSEVMSETGIKPHHLELEDGTKIDFNVRDIRQLADEDMTEAEYIMCHRLK